MLFRSTVSIAPASAVPGGPVGRQPVTATVVLSSVGPSPAGNAVVTLQLPQGVSGVVVSGGGVFDALTRLVTWPTVSFVPANSPSIATYTVTFVPAAVGGLVRSNVTTPDTEITLSNNALTVVLAAIVPTPVTPPEPIPTAPGWLIALLLMVAAGARLRRGRAGGAGR